MQVVFDFHSSVDQHASVPLRVVPMSPSVIQILRDLQDCQICRGAQPCLRTSSGYDNWIAFDEQELRCVA